MISFVLCRAIEISRRFIGDRRANVAVMMALLSPVLIGGFGIGAETAYWYVTQQSMQEAADRAAVAAATNASSSYSSEAQAVAAQMGFQNGQKNISIVASNSAACPSGGSTCYSVTITGKVPLYMAQLVGYRGDTTLNGKSAVKLSAAAVAQLGTIQRPYCILALAPTGTGFQANGVPTSALPGCNIMSDSNATCNGHNTGADIGDAHLSNNGGAGCGVVQHSNVTKVTDPYSYLAASIPANTCGSYPQEPVKKKDPALPASNLWTGSKTLGATTIVCGDLELTGNTTITAASSSLLVIENGQLDTGTGCPSKSCSLTTSSGGLTIIFSGTTGSYTHAPTGGGTLNFNAPTSGTWSGMAIYQNPALTTGVDISAAGNSPTWDITGMVYLPNANVTFSGIVNKSNNGKSCFGMVVNTITINGTGEILEHGECPAAGLTLPTGQEPGRGQLVG